MSGERNKKKKKGEKLDETVDYSVGARVLHTSSSPSYALCCRNLTVQLLVLPSPWQSGVGGKASVNHEPYFITSRYRPFAVRGSCISTLAERSPACITIIVAKMSAKTREFITPYLPLVLRVSIFQLSLATLQPSSVHTNREKDKVNLMEKKKWPSTSSRSPLS